MIQSIDYAAIAPPLILALMAGIVLLLDAFLPRRADTRTILGLVTLAGVLAALAAVITQAASGRTLSTFCVPPGPAHPTSSCSFVVDNLTLIFTGVILASAVVIVLLSATQLATPSPVAQPPAVTSASPPPRPPGTDDPKGQALGARRPVPPVGEPGGQVLGVRRLGASGLEEPRGQVLDVRPTAAPTSSSRIPAGEWYFLLLCTLTGAVALPASRDLIMLVVALELVSLPIFALAALKRYDAKSSEAALKLFLVSVISTAVMLFGVSLLYGLTGSVHLDRVAESLAGRAATPVAAPAGVLAVAIVLVLAGFAFKVAAVPFHFWAGDVYQGAPVPIAALLSVISKAAGFAGLILVLTVALAAQTPFWAPIVAVLAALTMTAGNLLALRQRQAVRLLAWSSVAQSGYILAPLGVQGEGVVAAATAYLAIYAAMNIGAFAVVMLVSRSGALDDYRGLAFRSPVAALSLAFFLICLAGLPPGLAGLFAKIVVFRELVQGGGAWLAVVMAVNTVIGLYYYIAWTARLFTPAPETLPTATATTVSAPVTVGTPAPAAVGTTALATTGGTTAPGTTGTTATRPTTAAGDTRLLATRPAVIAVAVALVVSVVLSVAPQLILSAVG